jgi:hypothetical protein
VENAFLDSPSIHTRKQKSASQQLMLHVETQKAKGDENV